MAFGRFWKLFVSNFRTERIQKKGQEQHSHNLTRKRLELRTPAMMRSAQIGAPRGMDRGKAIPGRIGGGGPAKAGTKDGAITHSGGNGMSRVGDPGSPHSKPSHPLRATKARKST